MSSWNKEIPYQGKSLRNAALKEGIWSSISRLNIRFPLGLKRMSIDLVVVASSYIWVQQTKIILQKATPSSSAANLALSNSPRSTGVT